MKKQSHGVWMMIGCILPLLLIFLLPAFGVKSSNSLLFFVLAMFACHFLMMGGHGHGHAEDENEGDDKKEEGHEGHEKKEKYAGHGGCH